MIETKELMEIFQKTRLEVLNRLKERPDFNGHNEIIQNLNKPSPRKSASKVNSTDISKFNDSELIEFMLSILYDLYVDDKKEFNNLCKNGQYVVWKNVFNCAENLLDIKNSLSSLNFGLRTFDYYSNCDILTEHLNYLAKAYKEMVLFEKKMGVERYLATSGLNRDVMILHGILRDIRDICNEKLADFAESFRTQWNLTSVSKAIKTSFNIDVEEDALSQAMKKNQEKVIYLLLDGFGYTQYLWFLNGLKERKNLSFGINLFEWLKSFEEYQDKFILASTPVTDTGSALTTIFSGESPENSGVVSSKLFDGHKIVDIKRTRGQNFRKLVKKYPNTFLSDLSGIDKLVLMGMGSRFVENDEQTNFSNLIYGDTKKIPVDPIDRIFKLIPKKINYSGKQLIIVYLPLIDRTGHSIGAFTSFESYEYEKLNILMVEFLLDLAYNREDVFDGKTKLIISADHGMFETSFNCVTLKEINNSFYSNNLRTPMVAINNRSLLLYNLRKDDLEIYKKIVSELLNNKGITHKVLCIDKPEGYVYGNYIMIFLFFGDGIALTHNKDELLLHYGGHGGCSCEELFVPFITLELTQNLHSELINQFSKIG